MSPCPGAQSADQPTGHRQQCEFVALHKLVLPSLDFMFLTTRCLNGRAIVKRHLHPTSSPIISPDFVFASWFPPLAIPDPYASPASHHVGLGSLTLLSVHSTNQRFER